MRILICDDQPAETERLSKYIGEYMTERQVDAKIKATQCPNDIIKSSDVFDLAFLDIEMAVFDGLSLAKELKKRNSKIIIFFITDHSEFQDDAMDLRVFRFFQKPYDEKRLKAGLDKAMEYLDRAYIDVFLRMDDSQVRVFIDDIIYFKIEKRKTLVITKDQQYESPESLETLQEKLPNSFFYRIHKSFVINLHHVTKCSYTEVYLNDNIRLAVAPRRQADFRKYWFNYLRGR